MLLYILQISGSNLGSESGFPYCVSCALSESSQASAGRVQDVVAGLIHSASFVIHYPVSILLFGAVLSELSIMTLKNHNHINKLVRD